MTMGKTATSATKVRTVTTKIIRTTSTLAEKEYHAILRDAVGAPAEAEVDIENNYGGDITITWEVTTYEEDVE
jgi:hypothetical protein